MELNKKVRELIPYEPLRGDFRIRLDANESFVPVPDRIRDKICDIIKSENFSRYPDPYATELCDAYGERIGVPSERIVAGNGSDELISVIMSGLCEKGDKIAVTAPDFSMYSFYCDIAETDKIILQKDENHNISANEIIEKAKDAKMLIFSNPCNPTGRVMDKKDVLKIVSALSDCICVVDEAYMDYSDQSILSESKDFNNLIILKTLSKAAGLAALRVGFAISSERIIRAIKSVKSPYNVNDISQKIALCVIKDPCYLDEALSSIKRSVSNLYKGLSEIAPLATMETEANFVVFKTDKAKSIYEYLLSKGIAVRMFSGFLRITAGSDFENSEVLKYIKEAVLQ